MDKENKNGKTKLTDEELKNITGGVKDDDIPIYRCDGCGCFIFGKKCPTCDVLIAECR